MTKLTSKWQTVATKPFAGSVSRDENRAAHGGTCLIQRRKDGKTILERRVNQNGRHLEVGKSYEAND